MLEDGRLKDGRFVDGRGRSGLKAGRLFVILQGCGLDFFFLMLAVVVWISSFCVRGGAALAFAVAVEFEVAGAGGDGEQGGGSFGPRVGVGTCCVGHTAGKRRVGGASRRRQSAH